MYATVEVTQSGNVIGQFTFSPGEYIIGSGLDCELPIQDQEIKPQHLKLSVLKKFLVIQNLASPQETSMDGRPLNQTIYFQQTSKILIGKTTINIIPSAKTLPSPSSEFQRRVFKSQQPSTYVVGDLVARGGMGVIHKAEDSVMSRTVAFKTPLPEKDTEYDLQQFLHEAKVNGQLEHPNIVPVYELGEDETGKPFYVMRLVDGITLQDILEKIADGDSSFIAKYHLIPLLAIFNKVCDAVAFAHSRGVVHRDLSPSNIMIGEYGEVFVLDWGVAKVLSQTDKIRKIVESPKRHGEDWSTIDGFVVGNPYYMSPEQAEDDKKRVDARSDVFALGAILYNILSLHKLNENETLMEMLEHRERGVFRPILDYNSDTNSPLPHCPDGRIPVPLAAVATKALSLKQEHRYQNVQDLQSDVRAYLGGFATSAEGAGWLRQTYLFLQRHKTESALVAGSLLVLTLVSIVFSVNLILAKNAETTALQRQLEAEHEKARLEFKDAAEHKREWHLIAEDDFSDADVSSRWQIQNAKWKVEKGELRIWDGVNQIVLFKKPMPGDVRLEFDCRFEDDLPCDLGCFLGASLNNENLMNMTSGYLFDYGSYLNTRTTLKKNSKLLFQELQSPLRRNEKYHVLAEKAGSWLKLEVNGKAIFKLQDPEILTGSNYSMLGLYGWKANTFYDNIRIYQLDPPLKSDLLETAESFLAQDRYDTAKDLFNYVKNSSQDAQRIERAKLRLNFIQKRTELTANLEKVRLEVQKIWPKAVLTLGELGYELDISHTGTRDLKPLSNISLETLNCSFNQIEDLSPLKAMPLKQLFCNNNRIESLAPLKGLPLERVVCQHNNIRDLSPLRRAPLNYLNCGGNPFSDLEALRDFSLNTLYISKGKINNLEPIANMTSLVNLKIDENEIQNLEPLRKLKLITLECQKNLIESLEPLRGMSLLKLYCDDNRIHDLEPLKETRTLETFSCENNPLTTLEPLVSNPPGIFIFDLKSLSRESLSRMRETWASRPQWQPHLRHLQTLESLSANQTDKIRSMAKTFNGHSYFFHMHMSSLEEAQAFCKKLGAHLLTITSNEENEFIRSLIPKDSEVWMGLKGRGKVGQWETGELFDFNSWQNETPEPSDVVFARGKWVQVTDTVNKRAFIIAEWDN